MYSWDNGVALTKTATAATAATATILAAVIATLTSGQKLMVSVDGGAEVQVTLSAAAGVVTKTTLASDLDALTGVTATVATNDVVVVSDTTGASSRLTIRDPNTAAALTLTAAQITTLTTDPDGAGAELAPLQVGTIYNVWVDGSTTGLAVTATGVDAAGIAADIDALAGVSAAVVGSDVVITSGTTGASSKVRLEIATYSGTATGTVGSTRYSAVGLANSPNGLTTDLFGIYVGGTGNLKIDSGNGVPYTITSVPVGFYPLRIKVLWDTGTTATGLVGFQVSEVLED